MIDVNYDFTTDSRGYWDGFWTRNDGLGYGGSDPDSVVFRRLSGEEPLGIKGLNDEVAEGTLCGGKSAGQGKKPSADS